MIPKKCPMTADQWGRTRYCDKSECSWWDNQTNRCVVLNIAEVASLRRIEIVNAYLEDKDYWNGDDKDV